MVGLLALWLLTLWFLIGGQLGGRRLHGVNRLALDALGVGLLGQAAEVPAREKTAITAAAQVLRLNMSDSGKR